MQAINSDISERLIQVIDYLGIKINTFGKILGYDRSQTIYDISKGKVKPSYEFILNFINSDISEIIDVVWLISGKGEMLKSAHKNDEPEPDQSECEKKYVDLLERYSSLQEKYAQLLEASNKTK